MMHMTFYWSRYVTLLFDSWKTQTWTAYALTLLACFIAPFFYQLLEDWRLRLVRLGASKSSGIEAPLLQRRVAGKFSVARFAGAVMFGINAGLGYMLMLAVMSFNGGVFLAVVLGLTVGYLVFRSGNEEVAVLVDNPCACA